MLKLFSGPHKLHFTQRKQNNLEFSLFGIFAQSYYLSSSMPSLLSLFKVLNKFKHAVLHYIHWYITSYSLYVSFLLKRFFFSLALLYLALQMIQKYMINYHYHFSYLFYKVRIISVNTSIFFETIQITTYFKYTICSGFPNFSWIQNIYFILINKYIYNKTDMNPQWY